MNTHVQRRQPTPVEIAPDLDWLDRVTGRAAVDPDYRELLLSRPAVALGDEALPVGLLALLARIETRELGEYARLAIEAEAAYRVVLHAARREELADLRALSRRAPVGAAA